MNSAPGTRNLFRCMRKTFFLNQIFEPASRATGHQGVYSFPAGQDFSPAPEGAFVFLSPDNAVFEQERVSAGGMTLPPLPPILTKDGLQEPETKGVVRDVHVPSRPTPTDIDLPPPGANERPMAPGAPGSAEWRIEQAKLLPPVVAAVVEQKPPQEDAVVVTSAPPVQMTTEQMIAALKEKGIEISALPTGPGPGNPPPLAAPVGDGRSTFAQGPAAKSAPSKKGQRKKAGADAGF